MERNRRNVVFDLLRERICEPHESAHTHPHREILAADKAGRNVFRIWRSDHLMFLATRANCRTVALLPLLVVAVDLDELRVIDFFTERLYDGIHVDCETVGCDLSAIRESGRHVRNEGISGLGIALAEGPARDEFG